MYLCGLIACNALPSKHDGADIKKKQKRQNELHG
jgi:hypothetical protein